MREEEHHPDRRDSGGTSDDYPHPPVVAFGERRFARSEEGGTWLGRTVAGRRQRRDCRAVVQYPGEEHGVMLLAPGRAGGARCSPGGEGPATGLTRFRGAPVHQSGERHGWPGGLLEV